MARLYLVRHAHAATAERGARDHARPLDGPGWTAAGLIGRALAARDAAPDLVLCSSAVRARETWDALGSTLPPPELSVEQGLYLAEPDSLLERLTAVPAAHAAVLLVGHNPGLHLLARLLAGSGDAEALARLEAGFPPAAAAAFEGADDWRALAPGSGRLEWLLLPETLA